MPDSDETQSKNEQKSSSDQPQPPLIETKHKVNQGETESMQGKKTKYYCAVEDKELNKVEMAYRARPQNQVILSDR